MASHKSRADSKCVIKSTNVLAFGAGQFWSLHLHFPPCIEVDHVTAVKNVLQKESWESARYQSCNLSLW